MKTGLSKIFKAWNSDSMKWGPVGKSLDDIAWGDASSMNKVRLETWGYSSGSLVPVGKAFHINWMTRYWQTDWESGCFQVRGWKVPWIAFRQDVLEDAFMPALFKAPWPYWKLWKGVWWTREIPNQHEVNIEKSWKILETCPNKDDRRWCAFAPWTEVIRGILAQPSATWKDIRSCVMAVSQVGLWSWRWDRKTKQEMPLSWKSDQLPHSTHFTLVERKGGYTQMIWNDLTKTTNINKCWNQQLDWEQNILDY